MNNNSKVLGHLLAVFTIFVWGTTFVSSKILLRVFTPVELLFDRFVLGYITLWVMKPQILKIKEKKRELLFAGAGLTGVTLYYLCENLALTYTQAANVSVIVSTAPLFVSILAQFFTKEEKLQKSFFIGFVFAITGIILLSFGGGKVVEFSLTGDGLCIVAAFVWAIYSIIIKKINEWEYSVILVTRRVFFYGILFMIPAIIFDHYKLGMQRFAEPVNLMNFLFLGIVACAICFVTWNQAVAILGAVKTSAYIYAVPVITLTASILVLREKVTLLMVIGIVLTIAGLIVSEWKGK